MCIAIYSPSSEGEVSEKVLRQCMENNPDGMGISYAINGRIHTFKTLKRFGRLIYHYKKARSAKVDAILHFRITTHGGTNIKNTHPFMIGQKVSFCHNGILASCFGRNKSVSDTRDFAMTVLQKLPVFWWREKKAREIIEDIIGVSNKMIFLDVEGKVVILNEMFGVKKDGVWFSNESYLAYTYFAGYAREDLCQWGVCTRPALISSWYCAEHDDAKWSSTATNDSRSWRKVPTDANVVYMYQGLTICAHCINEEVGGLSDAQVMHMTKESCENWPCDICNQPLSEGMATAASEWEEDFSKRDEWEDSCIEKGWKERLIKERKEDSDRLSEVDRG